MSASEIVHRYFQTERVRYGAPFDQILANELEPDTTERIFVVATGRTLESAYFKQLTATLGPRFCGVFSNVPAHVPSHCLWEAVAAAKAADAQLLVVLGGGSAVDLAKLIAMCLAYNITTMAELEHYTNLKRYDPSRPPVEDSRWIRSVAIPTTLSAAEFTWYAGVTDASSGIKRVVGHPMLTPRTVIYDPALTLDVPLPVFLASGIKAVDHAAERIASLAAQPFSDAVSKEALQMLAQALPQVAKDPADLDARLQCLLAAWLSIQGGGSGVRVGASHAIGHMLGPHASIPHGVTSCVMLASVMRWNKPSNHHRQAIISAALGQPGQDAADAIEALIKTLGLPFRLRDTGVPYSDLDAIARKTMEDPLVLSNPRPINSSEDIREILEMAY